MVDVSVVKLNSSQRSQLTSRQEENRERTQIKTDAIYHQNDFMKL